ncbi:hypothetical protein GPALN_010193 [Globodera pallida]|nr:hypothetical protein GPALN_010193 [Globodera pallida]
MPTIRCLSPNEQRFRVYEQPPGFAGAFWKFVRYLNLADLQALLRGNRYLLLAVDGLQRWMFGFPRKTPKPAEGSNRLGGKRQQCRHVRRKEAENKAPRG